MRHRLFKYFSERRWAETFLDGSILFRPLSYFRGYEDEGIRGDRNEGAARFRPSSGLVINNITQGKTFTLVGHSFESSVKYDEIFVFCTSRSFRQEHWKRFGAVACVEIENIKTFCERVEQALPLGANFFGKRVSYYEETEAGSPRWALPENIATSKLRNYLWQDEYRLVFSQTNALDFENVAPRIVKDTASIPLRHQENPSCLVQTASLRDICNLKTVPDL